MKRKIKNTNKRSIVDRVASFVWILIASTGAVMRDEIRFILGMTGRVPSDTRRTIETFSGDRSQNYRQQEYSVDKNEKDAQMGTRDMNRPDIGIRQGVLDVGRQIAASDTHLDLREVSREGAKEIEQIHGDETLFKERGDETIPVRGSQLTLANLFIHPARFLARVVGFSALLLRTSADFVIWSSQAGAIMLAKQAVLVERARRQLSNSLAHRYPKLFKYYRVVGPIKSNDVIEQTQASVENLVDQTGLDDKAKSAHALFATVGGGIAEWWNSGIDALGDSLDSAADIGRGVLGMQRKKTDPDDGDDLSRPDYKPSSQYYHQPVSFTDDTHLTVRQDGPARQPDTIGHADRYHKEETPQGVAKTGLFIIMKSLYSKIQPSQKPKTVSGYVWLWSHRILLVGLIGFFVLTGAFLIWVATLEIPPIGQFAERAVMQSTKIYDQSGEVLLYDVFEDEKRTVVPLERISPNMQKAIMAIEDDEFYNHNGVRPMALLRSVVTKIRNPDSRLAGGSTITQQVIKNALLTNDRAISRKVKEWVLAWRLEDQLSKNDILEVYLNEIPFGGPVYGVEQAAQSFYGIPADNLSIAQSAYLAALPKAPSTYLNNQERWKGRADYIMVRMRDLGFITPPQYAAARMEQVEVIERVDEGIKAPHFVFYVQDQLKDQFNDIQLSQDGLKVVTTLDWELQQRVEEIAAAQSERIQSNFGGTNVGVVVIENATGKIKAMVGSKDYFAEDIDGQFNIATALRQPGSTFKPFVYANAFARGYTPDTVLFDVLTEFSTACYPDGTAKFGSNDKCYRPTNYDKRTRGPITMANALAQSLNIPAVKALYLVGVGDSMKLAKAMGITSLNRPSSFYGLSLVLGGGEVSLIDMASAYSVFANGGTRIEKTAVDTVINTSGEQLYEPDATTQEVLEPAVAAMINEALSNNNRKRPMFGQNSRLYYENRQVAVKTGTTNSYRDTWTVGYDPSVTVAVWAGNNDNTPMAERPSSTVVGPFWREVMDVALEQYPAKRFADYTVPEGLKPILNGEYIVGDYDYYDAETGEIQEVIPTQEELDAGLYIAVGSQTVHSILWHLNKSNPRGAGNSQGDALYENFEVPVRAYGVAEGLIIAELEDEDREDMGQDGSGNSGVSGGDSSEPEGGDSDSDRTAVDFMIVAPADNSSVSADDSITIDIAISGNEQNIDSIFYYINNTYLGSGSYRTTSMRFKPSNTRGLEAVNTVRVIAETLQGRRIERTVMLNVVE